MEIGFYRFIFILMNFLDNICYKFYAFVAILSESDVRYYFLRSVDCVLRLQMCVCVCLGVCLCKQCKYCKQFCGIGGREWKGGWRLGRIDASTIRGLRLRMKIPYRTQKCEWNWSEVVILFVFSIDFDLLAVFVLHSRVIF